MLFYAVDNIIGITYFNSMNNEDIIIAEATPPGSAAISVIRLSGKGCIEKTDSLFEGKVKLKDAPSHTIHYGRIKSEKNYDIDDVLVSVFREPNSYTGEDSVEISTHGNPIVLASVINAFLQRDVRIAEPGEFTKRAFLNGRIDLAQAEAVIELISARSEAAVRGSRNQLDGLLSQKVNELRQKLINSISLVELELDFAEEDLEFIDNTAIINLISGIQEEIKSLLATYRFGRVFREGVNVALVGLPNVGKSSLLNHILKEKRAIVSPIPGTTRDVIREDVTIDGVLYRLFDTAGIRETTDVIEREGVERSRESVRNADLVLFINETAHPFDENLYKELLCLTSEDRIINVVNKSDLPGDVSKLDKAVRVSALTGEGFGVLFDRMKNMAYGGENYTEKNILVSSIRHKSLLEKAVHALENAKISAQAEMSGEFIAVDVRHAINSLGEIIGTVTTDDILNNIFMKFCIGK